MVSCSEIYLYKRSDLDDPDKGSLVKTICPSLSLRLLCLFNRAVFAFELVVHGWTVTKERENTHDLLNILTVSPAMRSDKRARELLLVLKKRPPNNLTLSFRRLELLW